LSNPAVFASMIPFLRMLGKFTFKDDAFIQDMKKRCIAMEQDAKKALEDSGISFNEELVVYAGMHEDDGMQSIEQLKNNNAANPIEIKTLGFFILCSFLLLTD